VTFPKPSQTGRLDRAVPAHAPRPVTGSVGMADVYRVFLPERGVSSYQKLGQPKENRYNSAYLDTCIIDRNA